MGNKDLVIQIIATDSQFDANYLVRGVDYVSPFREDAISQALGKWTTWITQMERMLFADIKEIKILEVVVD